MHSIKILTNVRYTPCTIKRIPDIFTYNSSMHIWILIICGRNVSQKVGN